MTNPNESNEAMRAKFEEWYEGYCFPLESDWFKKHSDGEYAYAETAVTWDAWQAAQQPQSVHPDALEALKNYQQADESGVMVLVSRQALDEAIRALIEPLSAADEHQKAVRDLVTYGQSFMVGDKHVPLSDVLLSAVTGGQESEAQAVAKVIFTNRAKPDVEWLIDKVTKGTILYTAPPSALAIDKKDKARGLMHIAENLKATSHIFESEAQADILDEEEFYNICQHYRWAKDNGDAGQAFENLKCFIRRIAPPSALAIDKKDKDD